MADKQATTEKAADRFRVVGRPVGTDDVTIPPGTEVTADQLAGSLDYLLFVGAVVPVATKKGK